MTALECITTGLLLGAAFAAVSMLAGSVFDAFLRGVERLLDHAKGLPDASPGTPPFAEAFGRGDRVSLVVSDGATVIRLDISREAAAALRDRLHSLLSPRS